MFRGSALLVGVEDRITHTHIEGEEGESRSVEIFVNRNYEPWLIQTLTNVMCVPLLRKAEVNYFTSFFYHGTSNRLKTR